MRDKYPLRPPKFGPFFFDLLPTTHPPTIERCFEKVISARRGNSEIDARTDDRWMLATAPPAPSIRRSPDGGGVREAGREGWKTDRKIKHPEARGRSSWPRRGACKKERTRRGCMEEGEGEGQWHKQVVLRTAKKLDEWTLDKEGRKAGGAA